MGLIKAFFIGVGLVFGIAFALFVLIKYNPLGIVDLIKSLK